MDDIYKTPADIARMVKLSLGHEISDEKATELLESFLTKGLSEYYTHIKSKALNTWQVSTMVQKRSREI